MLSATSFLAVLHAIKELISNSINTIREESWKNFRIQDSEVAYFKRKRYRSLLAIFFIEVRFNYLCEGFLEPIFFKNLQFKNNLRTTLKTLPFSSKSQNSSRNSKNSRTGGHQEVWNQIFGRNHGAWIITLLNNLQSTGVKNAFFLKLTSGSRNSEWMHFRR